MLTMKIPYDETENLEVFPVVEEYSFNGRKAITLMYINKDLPDCPYIEPWCDITVNLPYAPITDENCGYLDTNDSPYIVDFLLENNLGELTGRTAASGFCTYPEFRFNMERIKEFEEEGVKINADI